MRDSTFGHYEITDKIGEGGMGQVYQATDSRLRRQVALKVLPQSLAGDHERLQRFEREAQLLASLNHPNIATLHGLEEVDGEIALVMELIEGDDLTARIDRGAMPFEEAVRVALAIASAMESAHEKGVIHRDLKPGNVKLGPDGTVKVLDFGLAKAVETVADPTDVDLTQSPTISLAATQAGIILGTAAYMSPEQAAAQPVDRRCDIWSFGIVFYEMLTGERPFEGETLSHTLADVLRGTVDWEKLPADLPRPLLRLLERCLERDPQLRLRDIGEARIVLDAWLANPEAEAEAEEAVAAEAAAPAGWRAVLPWALAGLALAGLVGTLVLSRPGEAVPTKAVRFNVDLGGTALFASVGSGSVLSREGDALAFVVGDSTGNKTELHLRQLDQLESRPLAGGEGADQPYNPFFSPDGEWVGFVTPGGLHKVRTTGGSSMTLADLRRSRGATWGPNDLIILAAGANEGLSKVAGTGGALEPFTELDEANGEVSHRWPAFLPDGRHVVFTSLAGDANWDDANIEIIEVESGERREIFRGGTYGRILATGHLIYLNAGTLFAVPFDLDSLEVSGAAAPVVEGVGSTGEGGAHYSVSDDGTLVYLTGDNVLPRYPIHRILPNGHSETLWNQSGTYAAPRLSPDGERLAVTRELNNNWDIWVFDLARGSETRLTFAEGSDTEQIWSPDGEFIIWGSDREGPDTLYRKRSDGSGEVERLITEDGNQLWPTSWSPDGRYVAIIENDPQSGADILTLDLVDGGGTPEEFLTTEFFESAAAFSPDAKWIAYDSSESGLTEVYVRPFPAGGGKWQISAGGGASPRWSPDGRRIYYRTEDGFMVAEVDGSGASFRAERPSVALEGDFLGGLGGIGLGAFNFIAWDTTPDGAFIAFPSDPAGAGLDHATFVLNWTDELVRTLSPE